MSSLRKRFIPIFLLLTTILFFATIVQAQDTQDRVGIRQGNALNDLSISVTNYIGDCPGKDWSRPEVDFISSTELAEDRRVRIYNKTLVAEETPYTDREYEPRDTNSYISNTGSEPFYIAVDDEHSDRAFSLVKGKNKIMAIIYDGGIDNFSDGDNYQELDVYKFTVTLNINSTTQRRNLITSNPSIECEDPDTSLDSCSDDEKVKVRYQYCPGSSPSSRDRKVIDYLENCYH